MIRILSIGYCNFHSCLKSFSFCFYIFIIFLFLFIIPELSAQYLPRPGTGNDVYSFLDETDADFYSSVKPLGCKRILSLLENIDTSSLNYRQKKELSFYLKDFNKVKYINKDFDRRFDLLYRRDSLFSLTINPIGGANISVHSDGYIYHWWNGLYANATVGNWSFFASLTDNHESEELMNPCFLIQKQGGANIKKFSGGQQDYWEAGGGITYSWTNGHIGLIKENYSWGSGYHGTNIFSGRTPSFVHITFNLRPVRWFEFQYVHGWLVSEVIDSSKVLNFTAPVGQLSRRNYYNKFLAANLFTFKPLNNIYISAGNAIIYDYERAHPAYLIPVLFWKSVDHHLQSGMDNMNSMIFMDFSVKRIPHTHLFATIFVDEMAVKRIFNPDEFNFISIKGGFRANNLIDNTYLGLEYIWSNALAFRHYVPTLTYESNRYNLGHYLGDNAQELCLYAGYKPFPNTDISISYTYGFKGPDHTALNTPRIGIKPFIPVIWETDVFEMKGNWQIINDVWLTIGYSYQNIRGEQEYLDLYTPVFMQGRKGLMNIGIKVSR